MAEEEGSSTPGSAQKPTLPATATQQYGVTGLKGYTTGFLSEEFLPALRGQPGAKKFREMSDNDPVLGSVLFAASMMIRNVNWSLAAAHEGDSAQQAMEFVDECLFKDMATPFTDVVEEAMSMLIYGFAPIEKVYKVRRGPAKLPPAPGIGADRGEWMSYIEQRSRIPAGSLFDDGKIGIHKLSLRAQDTVWQWFFDAHGDWMAFEQTKERGPNVIIPRSKILLFRTTTTKNNPEARSILRSSYVSYERKKHLEIQEGRFATRRNGVAVFRIPSQYMDPSAPDRERAIFSYYRDLATKVSTDQQGGMVIPGDRDDKGNPIVDFEWKSLSATGTTGGSASEVIDRIDHRMAMSVLADFVLLGQGSVGSFALSSDKTNLFASALGGFLKAIAEETNSGLIAELCDLNGIKVEDRPVLRPGDIENRDLLQLSQYLSQLASAGMPFFPDDNLENWLRDQAGMPEKPEELDDAIEEKKDGEMQRQMDLMAAKTKAGEKDKPGAKGKPGFGGKKPAPSRAAGDKE
jgi:hypothetical protein